MKTSVSEYNADWLLLWLWVSQIIFEYYNIIIKMILRICTLVLLFLARLRFPSLKSIPKIIKDCYGENLLKLVRKFERTDLRCRKAELENSSKNSLTPSFYVSKFQIEA